MNLFNVDFNAYTRAMLPFLMRKPKTLAFLSVLMSPIKSLYNLFKKNRDQNLYFLDHNAQVVRMEAVLNDRWDEGLRRITITDGTAKEALIIYREDETKPAVYLFTDAENNPVALYQDSELDEGDDFVVNVPIDIVFDEDEMKALVNKYRLTSINVFSINIV